MGESKLSSARRAYYDAVLALAPSKRVRELRAFMEPMKEAVELTDHSTWDCLCYVVDGLDGTADERRADHENVLTRVWCLLDGQSKDVPLAQRAAQALRLLDEVCDRYAYSGPDGPDGEAVVDKDFAAAGELDSPDPSESPLELMRSRIERALDEYEEERSRG